MTKPNTRKRTHDLAKGRHDDETSGQAPQKRVRRQDRSPGTRAPAAAARNAPDVAAQVNEETTDNVTGSAAYDVCVRDLAPSVTERNLTDLFRPLGLSSVSSIRRDFATEKGDANLFFREWTEANLAVHVMGGMELCGFRMKMKIEAPCPPGLDPDSLPDDSKARGDESIQVLLRLNKQTERPDAVGQTFLEDLEQGPMVPLNKTNDSQSGEYVPIVLPASGAKSIAPALDHEGREKAVEFFAHPIFYKKGDYMDPYWVKSRQEAFREDSVAQVLAPLTTEKAVEDYFSSVITEWRQVIPYTVLVPIEERLHDQVVCLTDVPEIKVLMEEYLPLNSSQKMIDEAKLPSPSKKKRSMEACFVLGSSGSGKTFFAVKRAAPFGYSDQKRHTIFYLHPKDLPSFKDSKATAQDRVNSIFNLIRNFLKSKYKKEFDKLNMHVSLVLDEAGAPELQQFFEEKENIASVLLRLRDLGTTVWLVVSGTSLTAESFCSQDEVVKFRMKEWDSGDLEQILAAQNFKDESGNKDKFPAEQVSPAVAAVLAQPTLNALSSNARSAAFLTRCLYTYNKGLPPPDSWIVRLSDLTPTIVSNVVTNYIRHNGLGELSLEARRRVAASVLHAVYSARSSGKKEMPKFLGLETYKEVGCAEGLIDSNIENEGSQWKFARPERKSAVLITPALVVVVCSLLGAQARVLSNFEAQELVTVLYVFGTLAVDYINLYGRRIKKLEDQLSALKIARVGKAIPRSSSQAHTVFIPRLTGTTAWSNGARAPFADVVAPRYRLYQSKASQGIASVELLKEVMKCGLLASQTDDLQQIGLRGICAIWQGKFNKPRIVGAKVATPARTAIELLESAAKLLDSEAYPFNLVYTAHAHEDIDYMEIVQVNNKWVIQDGDSQVTLPAIPKKETITFILSTNGHRIRFEGPIEEEGQTKWEKFSFGKSDLVEGGTGRDGAELNVLALSPDKQKQWETFKSALLPNVRIKFLFTVGA
jgi:hypothetical protein